MKKRFALVALTLLTILSLAVAALAVPGPEPGSRHFSISITDIATGQLVDAVDFNTATGWDFGDRGAYRCAWVEHFTAGGLDFVVALDRVAGYNARINDRFGKESTNQCYAVDKGNAVFEGDEHFPHGTTLTFYRGGVPFETIDLPGGCSRGYWTPGDEPGEAWLWWDPDGPEETEHGLGDCSGGPEEPEPVLRLQVLSLGEGLGVCTADRIDGDICAVTVPATTESPPTAPPVPTITVTETTTVTVTETITMPPPIDCGSGTITLPDGREIELDDICR